VFVQESVTRTAFSAVVSYVISARRATTKTTVGKCNFDYVLRVGDSPLFQLVNEKNGAAQLAGGRVRDLRLVYVPGGVHVVFVGRVTERLDHVYGAFDFRADVVGFRVILLKTGNGTFSILVDRMARRTEVVMSFSFLRYIFKRAAATKLVERKPVVLY